MRYTVKNVKTHRGREGEPLVQCSLYLDGKKVAVYADGDWGGECRIWWEDSKVPKVAVFKTQFDSKVFEYRGTPEEAKFYAYLATLPKVKNTINGEFYPVGDGEFVSGLVDKFEMAKKCKSHVLYRLKNGEWYQIKALYSLRAKEHLRKKYGDDVVEILNETIGQVAV